MNKKIKYFIVIYIFFSIFLNAESIKKYDIDFKLLQSGELRVSENILYDFGSKPRHGIYRDIPYTIKLNDFNRDIGLYDFEVYQDSKEANYKKESFNSNLSGKNTRIKIGDKDKYITSLHNYKIDFSVELGVLNRDEKHDITSWNLIGNEWRYPINNIKAVIHLPESLSKSNTIINTFSGAFGSTTTGAKVKWLSQKSFEVSIAHLSAKNGLTVDILYPVNSLDESGKSNEQTTFIERFIGIWHWLAIFIIAMFNYNYFHRFASNKFARSIYPRYDSPKDLSILQSGVLYDKYANDKDFAPAVVELAQLGYLTINQTGNNTSILKLEKDTKELTDDMKYLLNNILFTYGTTSFEFKQKSNTEASGLAQKFKNLNENLYEWSYNKDYMQTNPKKRRASFLFRISILSALIMIISYFTSITIVGEDTTNLSLIYLAIVVTPIVLLFSKDITLIVLSIIFIIVSQRIFLAIYSDFIFADLFYTPFLVGLIIITTTIYIYINVGQYTRSGAMVKNHLDGLSEFISKVKEDEIKRRLKEDPLYLEKYLPYAILLGHSKHWLSFYSSLEISQPIWYHGDLNRIHYMSNDISKSVVSHTQNTSSGGGYSSSGGGGFSGGGSGGGGGGSW